MTSHTFQMPSYSAAEEPALGQYTSADGDLGTILEEMLELIQAGSTDRLPVPGLAGFCCRGEMLGQSIRLAVEKLEDDEGDLLDLPILVCTTFVALDDEDVPTLTAAALENAQAQTSSGANPSFSFAMANEPMAPFSVVIPQSGIVEAEKHGLLTFEEIRMVTGFFQTIIGNLLRTSQAAQSMMDPAIQWRMSEEINCLTLTARDIAGAIQTGGRPIDELIVEAGEDGYPEVYAFIADAELDVFRVDFTADTMILDTSDTSYIMMDDDILDTLRVLRDEAEILWEDMDPLLLDLEEMILDAEESGGDFADPLSAFHTNHPKIEIPADMAQRLTDHLGLSLRHAQDADGSTEDRERTSADLG